MSRAETKKNRSFPLLRLIWDEFVYGSHLLAVGDSLVIISLSMILGIEVTWTLPVVIYLSVLAINSYNRHEEFDQDLITNPERTEKMRKYIRFFPYLITLSLAVATIIVFFSATIEALVFMGVLFALGILYTLVFKGWTKRVIGFKNFSIALPYSLMVIFLSLYYNHPIDLAVIYILVFYYLRIFMSAMFFDIKDIKGDKKEGLKTFVVVFGVRKTTKILHVINVVSFIPIVIGVHLGLLPVFSLGLLATIPYSIYYIMKVQDPMVNKSRLYNLIADGEFVLWLPYLLIFKVLFS